MQRDDAWSTSGGGGAWISNEIGIWSIKDVLFLDKVEEEPRSFLRQLLSGVLLPKKAHGYENTWITNQTG